MLNGGAVTQPSADKAAILHEYFDAFNRRDVEAWVELNHPDVEMVPTAHWAPPGTSYHGRTGVRTYAHEMFRRLPYLRSEPAELRDLGDRILGRGTVATGRDHASASSRTIACLFMLKDGKVYRVNAFATEPDALEAARRLSKDQFRLLFQHALDAIVLNDDDARFVDANASACDLYGLSVDELRGRTLFEFAPRELVSQLEELWRMLRTHGQFSGESEIVSQAGERRLVTLRAKAEFVPGRHLVLLGARAETPGSGEVERVEPRLTAREREVFRLLARGFTGAEIAEQLVLSPYTVRTHVENGIAHLEAKNRVQAIAIALTSGEIEL
jgi:PAS domain S-box-containing protein